MAQRAPSRLYQTMRCNTSIDNYVRISIRNLRHSVIQESESIIAIYDGKRHSEEEVKRLTEKINKKINDSIEIRIKDIQDHISNEFKHLNDELSQLDDSELMKSLLESIRLRVPDDVSFNSPGQEKDKKKWSGVFGQTSKVAEKAGSAAAKVSKDTVYNIAKQIGMKFKPWGAVKLTKFIKGIGKVLGVFGVILDAASLASSEKEKKEQEETLRKAKTDVRSHFTENADKITKAINEDLQESIFSIYDEIEERIRQDIKKVSQLINIKTSLHREVEGLKKDINSVLKERFSQELATV